MREIDIPLLLTTAGLAFLGLLMVNSSTQVEYLQPNTFLQRHFFALTVGVILLVLSYIIHFKTFWAFGYIIYFLTVVLLAMPLLFSSGSIKRWVSFGGISFQPSEFAKLGLIIALANLLSNIKFNPQKLSAICFAFLVFLIPFALTIVEPDLTTAFILYCILMGMLLWRNVRTLYILLLVTPLLSIATAFHPVSWIVFIILLLTCLALFRIKFPEILCLFSVNSVIGILTPVFWGSLKGYQQKRLLSFINPGSDPKGFGWSIIQSKIAIGSGGLFGKGLFQGTQKKLSFLPGVHTDFIYSVICEEMGFIGSTVVIGLFFILIYRAIVITKNTKNNFASLLGSGIVSLFLSQTLINLGMALGILPVAGVPLPFISYGGSSLVVSLISVGLLLNIKRRRLFY